MALPGPSTQKEHMTQPTTPKRSSCRAAWWGWQAGVEAAAQVCDDLDPLLNGDLGVAGACADAIREGVMK